jgi:hypothetical protein
MASTAEEIVPKAVIRMNMLSGAASLIFSYKSNPFISGIITSEMMRS